MRRDVFAMVQQGSSYEEAAASLYQAPTIRGLRAPTRAIGHGTCYLDAEGRRPCLEHGSTAW
jgi:hypothetical protein